MGTNKKEFGIRWSKINCRYELKIPVGFIWWDDGFPGGGDWIVSQSISDEMTELLNIGFTQLELEELMDKADELERVERNSLASVPIDAKHHDKICEWLKSTLDKSEFWQPNMSEMQAMFGRRPCPKCGCLIEAEVDNDNPYCYECGKNVKVEIIV